jgi:hypothetical protein
MSYTDQFPNLQAMMLDKLTTLEDILRSMQNSTKDKNGMSQEEYLTVDKTAEFLDCSSAYVYQLKTKIPHVLRGARLYFKKSDLIEYMDRGRVVPDPMKRSPRRR